MKEEQIKQEFKEVIVKTKQDENQEKDVEATKKVEEVIRGAQEIHISSFGTLQFEWPTPKLTIEGDRLFAQFKAKHLRDGDLLTEYQLKAIYGRPNIVLVDGKEIEVGSGEWSEEDESNLENLPSEIDIKTSLFDELRDEIHNLKNEIDKKPKNTKGQKQVTDLQPKIEQLTEEAFKSYKDLIQIKLSLLELQAKRISLFSVSLEEQANLEKLQLYGPSCIKISKSGQFLPLWKDKEGMLTDSNPMTVRVLSLFGLFLRGVDVHFFSDSVASIAK